MDKMDINKYRAIFGVFTFYGNISGDKAEKSRPESIDWSKVLKICQQCDEYIKPDSVMVHGHCEAAIDWNKGKACGGCFERYLKMCEKQNREE